MFKFTVKRILLMIPSVIVITLLTFLIMANSSGSPGAIALGIKAKPEDIAAYNHEIGYDRPGDGALWGIPVESVPRRPGYQL